MLAFTILITYSTMAPFIMIFGVLYYCMAFVSNKYNIIYVNFPLYEGGGTHWVDAFNRIIAGTFLYQLVLVGVFGVYKFVPGAIISGICCGTTLVFCWYTHSCFQRSSKFLPIRYALSLSDNLDGKVERADQVNLEIAEEVTETKERKGKEKTEIHNLNYHCYYYQPSLVALSDEPEIDAPLPAVRKEGVEVGVGVVGGEEEMEAVVVKKGVDSGPGDV